MCADCKIKGRRENGEEILDVIMDKNFQNIMRDIKPLWKLVKTKQNKSNKTANLTPQSPTPRYAIFELQKN